MNEIERAVLAVIPIGQDARMSAREIWKLSDEGAFTSMRARLIRLAAHGLIKKQDYPIPGGVISMYWKESNGQETAAAA